MERTSTLTRVGAPVRLASGPSHVQRLGHGVLDVLDFRASEASYKERFGLVTSDEIALDEQIALGAFLRCDQGERYVDHHTLFLSGIGRARFNHAACGIPEREVAPRAGDSAHELRQERSRNRPVDPLTR